MPIHPRHSSYGPSLSATFALLFGLFAASCGDGAGGGSNSNGGQAGATSTAGAGGTTATITRTCEDPMPLLQEDGSESGFVRCKDGSLNHDKVIETCQPVPSQDQCDPNAGYVGSCKTSADCTEHAVGYCFVNFPIPSGMPYCACRYQCQTDADCAPGQICACGSDGDWPTCIDVGNCKESADCPSGECGVSYYSDGCGGGSKLECRTDSDQCRVVADCNTDNVSCSKSFDADNWVCTTYTCIP